MTVSEPLAPQVADPVESYTYAVRLHGVHKSFDAGHRRVEALRGVTLDVRDGELLCILGSSGCGKSTLLNLIADLMPLTSGTIRRSDAVAGRGGMGMVFQSPVLLPWRRVMSNVMVPAEALKLPARQAKKEAVELIERVGLSGFERAYPHELSGGMQQRVSIARALLSDPRLLLMDEPFGALDALTREEMNLDLERVWAQTGKTVVLVTHSIEEAVFLADRIVVMRPRPGRIAEIIDNPLPRPRTLESMGQAEFVAQSDHLRHLIRELSHKGSDQ